MGLITVEKPDTKATIKFQVSANLATEFENQLAIFNKANEGGKLNFDNFASKLISELKKINSKSEDKKPVLE